MSYIKVHRYRSDNLLISLPLHKNNRAKVPHYNSISDPRYMKCLFTNIQKQQNMKGAYFLRKSQTSRVNNSRILRIKNARFSEYYFYLNPNI